MNSGATPNTRRPCAVIWLKSSANCGPAGSLVIRDVVGPEDSDREILLWCSDCDGENPTLAELDRHATREAAW